MSFVAVFVVGFAVGGLFVLSSFIVIMRMGNYEIKRVE